MKVVLPRGGERHSSRKTCMPKIKIEVELEEDQALALAQYLKRYTWTDIRGCAVNDEEAYLMRSALDALQRVLANEGFSPR